MPTGPHAGWKTFDDPRFELTFRYPDPTPQGRPVEVLEGGYTYGLRMHFASPERELYIEVVRFDPLPHEEEHARHKALLEGRDREHSVSALTPATLAGRPADSYVFTFPEGRRVALLLSTATATYRVIYNPESPLNDDIIATFALKP